MKRPTVFICGYAPQYASLFSLEGWYVVADMADADVVCFIGGADVNPALYNEACHHSTHYCENTDDRDIAFLEEARKLGKSKVGICRGGQFLNVMNGGSMWQDVDHHGVYNGHQLVDLVSGHKVHVTSTHHQMMIPGESGQVLAVASETSYKTRMENGHPVTFFVEHNEPEDTEVVFYPEDKCLCFQPHPEINSATKECREYFFNLIEHCLGFNA